MAFQSEKELIRAYYRELENASPKTAPDVLACFGAQNWLWRGFHPFNEQMGAQAIANGFWASFLGAFTSIQRRQDIFFAGRNEIDGFQSVWVVSMGHLVGLFDQAFLGIAPTRKMAFFRYCEFNRVENGKIAETAFYFDLPHLMVQAGLSPFPSQRGAELVQPGPIGHNGLLFAESDPASGAQTLKVINAMIGDLGQWQGEIPLEEELRQTWHEDMIWWGPTGIGATYTIPRYAEQHSAPFRSAFANRSKTKHLARLAEGEFGGFFGWPNFTANLRGEFLGLPPSDIRGEFRVIDIYRRHGDKLAENWVFIDLPHWMKCHGIDMLPR